MSNSILFNWNITPKVVRRSLDFAFHLHKIDWFTLLTVTLWGCMLSVVLQAYPPPNTAASNTPGGDDFHPQIEEKRAMSRVQRS